MYPKQLSWHTLPLSVTFLNNCVTQFWPIPHRNSTLGAGIQGATFSGQHAPKPLATFRNTWKDELTDVLWLVNIKKRFHKNPKQVALCQITRTIVTVITMGLRLPLNYGYSKAKRLFFFYFWTTVEALNTNWTHFRGAYDLLWSPNFTKSGMFLCCCWFCKSTQSAKFTQHLKTILS